MDRNFEVGSKEFWVGRHSGDEDTLVFDPAVAQSASGNVTFFSLTQFRPRSFAPGAARDLIHGITDAKEVSAAKRAYKRWPELKAERDQAASRARGEVVEQRRSAMIERHEAFLAALPTPENGKAAKSGASARRRRATKCSACGRDFNMSVEMDCDACGQRVCSCGACGCGTSSQKVE